MAQSSQSTPTVTANISGTTHQVNLRDYLNIRVAPFLKKAIAESLDAAPEFPLQWLGENLIRQSMLYEGNPDSNKIQERFLYNFDVPAAVPIATSVAPETDVSTHTESVMAEPSPQPATISEGGPQPETSATQDSQMSNLVNGNLETEHTQREELRDTEMEDTS